MNADGRAALARIASDPTFELLPLKSVDEQVQYLPRGARISITASPAKGLDATVAVATRLAGDGFRVVPHLSARMVRDRAHLGDIVAALAAVGIRRIFVVGGDEQQPGAYADGLALLRDLREVEAPFSEIGVPCYPEGHQSIANDVLLRALREKAAYATYMTTLQLCFNPGAIVTWLAARRAEGLALPLKSVCRASRRCTGCSRSVPHRREGHRPVPLEEPRPRRPDRAIGRVVPARRAARGTRPSPQPTRGCGSSRCTCTPSTRSRPTEAWRQRYLAGLGRLRRPNRTPRSLARDPIEEPGACAPGSGLREVGPGRYEDAGDGFWTLI